MQTGIVVACHDGPQLLGRGIVHDDYLEAGIGLRKAAVQCRPEESPLVGRNSYGEENVAHLNFLQIYDFSLFPARE